MAAIDTYTMNDKKNKYKLSKQCDEISENTIVGHIPGVLTYSTGKDITFEFTLETLIAIDDFKEKD